MSQREGGGVINTGVAQICVYFCGEGGGGGNTRLGSSGMTRRMAMEGGGAPDCFPSVGEEPLHGWVLSPSPLL